MVLWPGFLAHFLITGLHGDDGILGSVASTVEIAINAVLYAWLLTKVVSPGNNSTVIV